MTTTGTVYTYVHCKPDGMPFYVGKGKIYRANNLNPKYRNPYHGKVTRKYGIENILIGTIECSTNAIALELEVGVIKCFKRMGIKLSNITNGGEGALGRPCSDKCKASVAEANKNRVWTKEARANMAVYNKGIKKPWHSEQLKSLGKWKGENNLWYGKGNRQLGAKNHRAKAVQGVDKNLNVKNWETLKEAADELGISLQAVSQNIKKGYRSKGWLIGFKL